MKYFLLKSRRFIIWIICFIFLILAVFFGILSAGKFIFNLYCYAKYPSWYLKNGIFYVRWRDRHFQLIIRDIQIIQKNTKNIFCIDSVIIKPQLSGWHIMLLRPNITLYNTPFIHREPIDWSQIIKKITHSLSDNEGSFFFFLKKRFFFSVMDMQIHFLLRNKEIMSLTHFNAQQKNQEISGNGMFFYSRVKRCVSFNWYKNIFAHIEENKVSNFPLMMISYFINPNLVLMNKNTFFNIINHKQDVEISIRKTKIFIHISHDVIPFYGVIDLKELSNIVLSSLKNKTTSVLRITGRILKNQIFGSLHIGRGEFLIHPYFIQVIPIQGNIQFHIDRTRGVDLFGKIYSIHNSTISFFVKSKDFFFQINRIVRLSARNILLRDLRNVWPMRLQESLRVWITKNIRYGLIKQVTLINKTNIFGRSIGFFGKIEVKNAMVQYFSPLPAAQHVFANILYNKNGLDIYIQKGLINKINISNSHINLDYHPFLHAFMMHIQLNQNGSLKDLMYILDKKPLLLIQKLDERKIYQANGQVNGIITFDFPLMDKLCVHDIHIQASGLIKRFLFPIDKTNVFYGNNIYLTINDSGLIIKGNGVGAGFPITFRWKKNFYNDWTTVDGVVKLQPQANWPIKWINPFSITFFYQRKNGESLGHMSADLTPYFIESPMLLWKHFMKSPLLFSLDMEQNKQLKDYLLKWSIFGIKTIIRGYCTIDKNGKILTFSVPQFLLPRNNGSFQFYNKNGKYFWNLRIARINFSRWMNDIQKKLNIIKNKDHHLTNIDHKKSFFALPSFFRVHASIDRIVDQENHPIYHNFLFDWNRDNQYTTFFNISADDQKQVSCIQGKMSENFPQNIKISFCSLSNLLRAIGYSDSVEAGAVKIIGSRMNQNSPIQGKIILKNYQISNLPILGNLLHVISVVGLTKANDSSVKFYQMVLSYKLFNNILSIKHGYMYGLSTGLTIDEGYIDFNHNNIFFKGGVVPAFFINQAIGTIPVIGYLLTGGHKGGLLTMSYVVCGPITNPQVHVNPMTVLLPGFLRNWLSPSIKKPHYGK